MCSTVLDNFYFGSEMYGSEQLWKAECSVMDKQQPILMK